MTDAIGFGFGFGYDADGRFQALTTASGEVNPTTPDGLEGSFESIPELADLLIGAPQVDRCFAIQWSRFALQRLESSEEQCVFDGFSNELTKSEGGRVARRHRAAARPERLPRDLEAAASVPASAWCSSRTSRGSTKPTPSTPLARRNFATRRCRSARDTASSVVSSSFPWQDPWAAVDFAADPLGSLVAITFGLIGAAAWILALRRILAGDGIGIQERWGGFGHGLGGWQVTPAFALTLVGASAIGIAVTVMQSLPERVVFRDFDADGVLDRSDQCPAALEDFDGFEDQDGCPDPDNDGDGILDVNDHCPLHPEDIDGFEDANGCPDP